MNNNTNAETLPKWVKNETQDIIALSDSLPTLERQTIVPDDANVVKEVDVSYKCYCCQDTGFVVNWMVEKIIPGYNLQKDKFVICDRLYSCTEKVPSVIIEKNLYDERFDSKLLDTLDKLNRKNWRVTLAKKNQESKKQMVEQFCNSF